MSARIAGLLSAALASLGLAIGTLPTPAPARPCATPDEAATRAVRFRLVCAWCTKVSEDGTPGAPVSHGICDACLDVELAKLTPEVVT